MPRNLYNIAVGDRVIIDGIHYVLDSMAPARIGAPDEKDVFQFRDPRVNRIATFTEEQFLKRYGQGKVRCLGATERVSDRLPELHDAEGRPDACGERALEKARQRLKYLQAYDREPVSKSTRRLAAFIKDEAARQGDARPPSPGALRRWIEKRGAPDDRRLGEMVDRRPRGPQGFKLHDAVETILAEESEPFWQNIRVTVSEVWARVSGRVGEENQRRKATGEPGLSPPVLSTVSLRLRQLVTLDRACRRWGKREGLRKFGLLKGSMEAERILDIAIIDHTTLDCWVIDDVTGQPIGRPRLTIMIDSCSRYPLGFHVGWRDASVEAVMACLRHAVRPKDYIRERYPSIRQPWLAYGQPRSIVTDQGLEFMGRSLEDACATLGISIHTAPVRTPEYKGQVERLFRTFNEGVFHKLPGSVPFKPSLMQEFGIDPEKTAVLLLSQVEEEIHRFICDVYALQVHRTLGAPPAKVWRDRMKTDVIELARDLSILDRACATVTSGKVTKEGIKLNNLIYRSEALASLRLHLARGGTQHDRAGGSMRVKIAYQPEDLGQISVWDPVLSDYIDVPCTRPKYAQGLSLSLHKMIREWSAKANCDFQTEHQMVEARTAFFARIAELRPARVTDRKRLQRVRHPEREVRSDIVRFVEGQPDEANVRAPNEVRIDPSRNRVAAEHLEKRGPLGGKRRSGKMHRPPASSRDQMYAAEGPSDFASMNWASLLDSARADGEE